MSRASVLKEKNALPRSEFQFSVENRYGLARSREHHTNVGGAVIAALVVVLVICVFWNQLFEKSFQVTPRGWRRIFHDRQAATGVLHEEGDSSVANSSLIDFVLYLAGNFVGAFAAGLYLKLFMDHPHILIRARSLDARLIF